MLNKLGRWIHDNFSHLSNISTTGLKYRAVTSGEISTLANILTVVKKFVNVEPDEDGRYELTEDGSFVLLELLGDDNDTVDTDQLVKMMELFKHKYRKKFESFKADYETRDSLIERVVWSGGSESSTFNRLEQIPTNTRPRTPVLQAEISRALDTRLIGRNYLTSRINWVVQSSAVDFLHLLLVTTQWLFQEMKIRGRFVISIHDEVRYMVVSEDRYKAALALHLANLLVRSEVCAQLGLTSVPASCAFFSSVDIDKVIPSSDWLIPNTY